LFNYTIKREIIQVAALVNRIQASPDVSPFSALTLVAETSLRVHAGEASRRGNLLLENTQTLRPAALTLVRNTV
jgi:hypothetical protein